LVRNFQTVSFNAPRGFSFTAIRHGKTLLLVYSVHFKSNRGEVKTNIAKREEAARQLLAHVAEMENAYSGSANMVTIIAGDFNTDPTDAAFRIGTNLHNFEGEICLALGKPPAIASRSDAGKGGTCLAFAGFQLRREFSQIPVATR
jgi:endonuclease/exonuclease/phosphatase family metal-dependent hydrolase